MSYTPTLADAELEAAIAMEVALTMYSPEKAARAAAMERAQQLHTQRTPQMVEHLERQRGLRQ